MWARAARDLAVLSLVAVVTWLTATNSVQVDWIPLEAAIVDDRWMLLPVGGALLMTLFRRRAPVAAIVGAAVLFGWWPASAIALAVAAFEVAVRVRGARRRMALLSLAAALGYAVSLLTTQFLIHTRLPVTMVTELHVATALVCLALPAGARALLERADFVVSALRERTRYLEEVSRLTHSAARIQERSRIAQEMHDQLGHRLSLISLYAGGLELTSAKDGSGGAKEATLIRGTAQTAMQELRAILGILRTTERDDAGSRSAAEIGLRPDIARLADQSKAAGVEVDLSWHGDDLGDVAVPLRRAVHRIVREGLTNMHRHAPGSAATIVVERSLRAVRVEVSNGRHRTPAATSGSVRTGTGLGLAGVQERVRLLGGEFVAGGTPDGGFRLTAELPLAAGSGAAGPPAQQAAAALHHTKRRVSFADRWIRYGSSAVLAGGLVGVAAFIIVVLTYLPWYSTEYQTMPAPPADSEPRIGMTRTEAVAIVGEGDVLARLAARSVESRPPVDSSCLYGALSTIGAATILRYCFRQERLISIDEYHVDGSVSGVAGP